MGDLSSELINVENNLSGSLINVENNLSGSLINVENNLSGQIQNVINKINYLDKQDTSIPLLWRLLSLPDPNSANGDTMAVAMRKNQQFIDSDGNHKGDDMNHLTWTQYESTWFFSNKSDTGLNSQWEKLFQMTGAMIPSLSTICPGVAMFAAILQGYLNELLTDGSFYVNEPGSEIKPTQFLSRVPIYYNIVMKEYLDISNIVQRVLTLESQLGLDPRLENPVYIPGSGSPSEDQYIYSFHASNKGIQHMQGIYQDKSEYFKTYINWKAFVEDTERALYLCTVIDDKCPFRYSEAGGIGQAFLTILFGHWNNLLAAAGLLGDGTTPDELGMATGIPGTPYYLSPQKGEGTSNTAWFNNAMDILKTSKLSGTTVNAPVYSGMYFFLPISGGYGALNKALSNVIDKWLKENNGLGKFFYAPQIN